MVNGVINVNYGYCRISTDKQNIERQIRNIQKAYPDAVIKQEIYTGTKTDGRKVFEQLKQRQREGIEIAKAQGKYTGRKPIEIDWTRFGQLYGEWKSKSITGRDFMRRMGLSANTFYRRVREYEATHGIAEPVPAWAYCTEDLSAFAAPCTNIITITPQGLTPAIS